MGCSFRILCRDAKKNELIDELTYWYGVDVGSLPPDRQVSMHANLPRMQAQKRIIEGRYNPTDYDGVYDLFLLAYGDEQLALNAELESKKVLMRQETEAARLEGMRR